MRRLRRGLLGLVLGTVLVALVAGCAPRFVGSSLHADARQAVRDVVRAADFDGMSDDFDVWVRRVAEYSSRESSATVTLIGSAAADSPQRGEVIGRLSFHVAAERRDTGGFFSGPSSFRGCFWVDISAYGPQDGSGRTSVEARDIVHYLDCPDPLPAVTPVPDTSPIYVLPAAAERIVHDVLAEAPADATEADIVSAVVERLPVPTGEREVLFPPTAIVDPAGAIGVAMGDADDCLLVRRGNGVVETVYPPRIALQVGEAGCLPPTALMDIQSPH